MAWRIAVVVADFRESFDSVAPNHCRKDPSDGLAPVLRTSGILRARRVVVELACVFGPGTPALCGHRAFGDVQTVMYPYYYLIITCA